MPETKPRANDPVRAYMTQMGQTKLLTKEEEVNIFSARHYDSDIQLYGKFTAKTGIKVNVVSGKSKVLEKRIIEA